MGGTEGSFSGGGSGSSATISGVYSSSMIANGMGVLALLLLLIPIPKVDHTIMREWLKPFGIFS